MMATIESLHYGLSSRKVGFTTRHDGEVKITAAKFSARKPRSKLGCLEVRPSEDARYCVYELKMI
jgi:hypothetical protein